MSDHPNLYLLRAADIAARSQTFSHPWNPNSEITGYQMAKATGLRRTGVNLARIPPGKESFAYHAHWQEEEWIYILAGRGVALIDGIDYEVGPGDFMAFPTPGVAHHLRNPFDQELVYLMGGEHRETEVADFPRHGKRMFRHARGVEICDLSNAKPFGPLDSEER
ncbi:MAG TPA: cupin domain-containing protein [Povalibacter sp.]|nr:cupin domain-containing protein [Povalibacter sp.]